MAKFNAKIAIKMCAKMPSLLVCFLGSYDTNRNHWCCVIQGGQGKCSHRRFSQGFRGKICQYDPLIKKRINVEK
jgi:hypothetical protein